MSKYTNQRFKEIYLKLYSTDPGLKPQAMNKFRGNKEQLLYLSFSYFPLHKSNQGGMGARGKSEVASLRRSGRVVWKILINNPSILDYASFSMY